MTKGRGEPPNSARTLVLVPWEGGNGVFFHKADYKRLSALQSALRDSRTWAEFRSCVGDDEFFGLNLWVQRDGEHVYEDSGGRYLGLGERSFDEFCEDYDGEYEQYVIRPDTPFQADDVPGFCEGDYPPWLYSTAENALPLAFRKQFGEPVSSMVSGSWWEFPLDRFDEMAEALSKLGFAVERAEAERGGEGSTSTGSSLEQAYRATAFEVETPQETLVLLIDHASADLKRLMADHGATSAAYVTAWNPRSEAKSATENEAAHERLMSLIADMGLASNGGWGRDPTGRWPPERSVLILGIPIEAARELGRAFGQNAIVLIGADAIPRLEMLA